MNGKVSWAEYVDYFIFDLLVLLSIMFHQYVLIFLGMWDKREHEIESVP